MSTSIESAYQELAAIFPVLKDILQLSPNDLEKLAQDHPLVYEHVMNQRGALANSLLQSTCETES